MTILGDLDRQLLSQRHTRYAYLYGRASLALRLIADGIVPGDVADYAAGVLAGLDQAEAEPVEYAPWEE